MLEKILIDQLYGGNGWRVVETVLCWGTFAVTVHLVPTRQSAVCSQCGVLKRKALDVKKVRRWRHIDTLGWRTDVIAPLRRVDCRRCGIRVERVPWARVGSHLTHRFEAEILDRARETSILGVCRQLRVHWTTVMRLIERWVMECAEKRFHRPLRRIGVDEISYGRGQKKYLTIVWDHDRGEVVWIGKGRDQDTLDSFFAKLGRRRSQRLECITMDMAKGYITAAEQHAGQADVVFDRFHIEQYLTKAVNEVRKAEFWRRGGQWRELIKGKKFLLLKKRRRLHWRRRRELDALLSLNRRLYVAYVLKEQFDHAWTYTTPAGMLRFLQWWRGLLRWQRLRPLVQFWGILERHMDGVIAWAKHHLSNAALEGNNARIRGISIRARGYRNPDNLMMVLYHASWRGAHS